ncbi:MAG: hypothetical protein H0X03_03880 [Nitrosopumilus sp.]|nr:hypothetical protein [Nitrosopumilus sp.]
MSSTNNNNPITNDNIGLVTIDNPSNIHNISHKLFIHKHNKIKIHEVILQT